MNNIENLSYKEFKNALKNITSYDSKEIERLKALSNSQIAQIKKLEAIEEKTDENKEKLKDIKDNYFRACFLINYYSSLLPVAYIQADWLVYYCYISMPKEQFDTLVKKANIMLSDYMTFHKDLMSKENRKLKLTMEECIVAAENNEIKEALRKSTMELMKLNLERKIIEEKYKSQDMRSVVVQAEYTEAINDLNTRYMITSKKHCDVKKQNDEIIMCSTSFWFENVINKYCPREESSKLFAGAKRYYFMNIKNVDVKKKEIKKDIVVTNTEQVETIKEIVKNKFSLSEMTDKLILLSEKYKDLLTQKDKLEKEIFLNINSVYKRLDSTKDGMTKDDFIDFVKDIFNIPSRTINEKLKGL